MAFDKTAHFEIDSLLKRRTAIIIRGHGHHFHEVVPWTQIWLPDMCSRQSYQKFTT